MASGAGGANAGAATAARVRTFTCASCGADVVWSPGSSALKCPYCGAERAVPRTPQEVREQPIEEGLHEPSDLGWGAERKAVRCSRCGATTTLEPNVAASSCAFCGAPAVVEAPPDGAMIRPKGLLPFKIDRDRAAGAFRGWLARLWFRPGDLKEKASLTALRGVYVPFWTFDAATHSAWSAESGTYYNVSVQAEQNGQRVTRQERRVRWEPAEGVLEKLFDDVAVPASRGLDERLSRQVEPFPTAELVPYEPAYLSGFLAEEYALGRDEALVLAKRRMAAEIRSACAAQVPGDTYRNLEVETRYTAVTYKAALLPLWIAAYEYAGRGYRYLVNGVTGKATGSAPYSWLKISLAVLVALLAFVLLALASGHGH